MKWATLAVCVLLLPACLASLRWAWFWSNQTGREIAVADGILAVDYYHSGPPEVIALWVNPPGRFDGYPDEFSDLRAMWFLFRSRRSWLPT